MNTDDLCMGCMNENTTGGPCPICGYSGERDNPDALIPKTMLKDRYVVGRDIDSDGEGITYIGYDLKNDAAVNIREYYPAGHCERSGDRVLVNQGDEPGFNEALLAFLELSKTLYSLNGLSALFDTVDIFEENNTAYRVSGRLRGLPLREYLLRSGGTLKFDAVKALFSPLVSSVKTLHDAGIIHGGISPDTLIVCRDGRLRITGFCVRDARVKGGFLTPHLYTGYAAIEQYGSIGSVGPWTDVYGIAATVYRAFIGNAPAEAPKRLNDDNLSVPRRVAEALPESILEMLSMALQILPDDRIQSAEELRTFFTGAAIQMRRNAAGEDEDNDGDGDGKSEKEKKKKNSGGKKYGFIAAGVTVGVLLVASVLLWFFVGRRGDDDGKVDMPFLSSGESSSREETVSDQSQENTRAMPRFVGQTAASVLATLEYTDNFEFEIAGKEYQSNVRAGVIYKQEPEENARVEEGVTVKLYVSLGPKTISMPNLIGRTKDEAILALYRAGFPYSAIEAEENVGGGFVDGYDESREPGVVIDVTDIQGNKIRSGQKVSPDIKLVIAVNNVREDESSDDMWGYGDYE